MADASSVLAKIKDEDIKFVDLRFTDPRGKLQHVTMDVSCVDEDMFNEGVPFDGSSIAGWKDISQSDMLLMPDVGTVHIDPFFAQSTLSVFCDILEPDTGEPYERDPRGTAKMAQNYLKSTGIGDKAFFGPEPEFFVFDDVRFSADPYNCGFQLDSTELPSNSDTEYEMGNLGHRPRTKGGYFPVPPVDASQDIRSEMLSVLKDMGVSVEKHHHEVAAAQHELGMKFNTLLTVADHVQIYKYAVHNVAQAYGKTATFMPKPVFGDNGTGMHVHQSIWNGDTPVFAGNQYADLSETCLHYIGGILKHAKVINAFSNPITNSYKRLVPGYEAPVLLAYSSRNRSASCRIPHVANPKANVLRSAFLIRPRTLTLPLLPCLWLDLTALKTGFTPVIQWTKTFMTFHLKSLKASRPFAAAFVKRSMRLMADVIFLRRAVSFLMIRLMDISNLRWKRSSGLSLCLTRLSLTCTTQSNSFMNFEIKREAALAASFFMYYLVLLRVFDSTHSKAIP